MVLRTILVTFFLCFYWTCSVNAQTEAIEIVEVKEQNKVVFYAINHTETLKEVFFKVDGEGFRKSAFRPVIKKVPANTKILLITLIPLKNETPTYTYFSSFDDELEELSLETTVKTWKELDYLIDNGETIIFIKDECAKCEKLIGMLKANRISHKAFDVSENERYTDFFWNTVSKMKRQDVLISSIPIAIVKGKLYEGLDLISFVEMLKE